MLEMLLAGGVFSLLIELDLQNLSLICIEIFKTSVQNRILTTK
jgi:hypothetical protein